ncbi:MAG: M23 family metallopeptidase [Cellulomonadaceae bacterium]|nr:M23 family metallopeptidase [Cellulomonadaceae bacterium]
MDPIARTGRTRPTRSSRPRSASPRTAPPLTGRSRLRHAGLVATLVAGLAVLAAPSSAAPLASPADTGAVLAHVGAARTGASTYRLPVDGPVVATFRAPAQRWGPGHRGVDLMTEVGAGVLAPADGTITFSGVVVDRSVVTITHPDGLRTSLEPVVSTLEVGDRVTAGDAVGTVQDAPGHCPQACVHWGVRQGDTYLDPLSLLEGAGPVVLLPVP